MHTHTHTLKTHPRIMFTHRCTRTHKALNGSQTHPATNHTHIQKYTYIHTSMHACTHTKSFERPSQHPPLLLLLIHSSSLGRFRLSSSSFSISQNFFSPSFKAVVFKQSIGIKRKTKQKCANCLLPLLHAFPQSLSFFTSFLSLSRFFLPLSPVVELG